MSNIEQIDFSTLTWVKTELDETLNRAKEALKTYVEDTDDTNQLQFCITYLHQIQGTLKMVELYGAAMVAEEMEAVAKDLLNGKVKDEDSAYDVLMQSILQLPDYLERIELGHKDVPIVLLPLVNDLRAVRSQKLLSEGALFNPNLDLGVPERILSNDVSLKGNQLKTALLKLRSVYQISLLNWIKQNNSTKALNNIKLVVSKLQMILSPDYLKQLFWTYSGVIEGMLEGEIEDNVSIKQISGKIDLLIKELGDSKSHTKSSSRAITKNLLYYIAICNGKGRLVNEIKSFFDLGQFIPDEGEIKHAEGSLSGKNKELLQTVTEAIKDDVLVVQESLDLFIRNKAAKVEQLAPLLDNLNNIADTLGILGLGVARDSVIVHQKELEVLLDDDVRPSDENLLEVAKTLLQIESQLGDHIQSLGISDGLGGEEENAIPSSEKRAILQQLAKESIINLQQIKANFVAFIESPWDKNQVKDNPRLLKDIAGALKILNLSAAGEHLDDIIEYVNTDILASDSKPSAKELEQLATVISSLEYYLENLDQGQKIRENLLAEVSVQIKQLQNHVVRENEQVSQDEDKEEVKTEPSELTQDVVDPLHETLTEQDETLQQDSNVGGSIDSDMDETEKRLEVETETKSEPEVAKEAEVENEPEVPKETEPEAVKETESLDQAETNVASDVDGLAVIFGDDVDEEIKEVFLEEFEEELANMQEKHALWKEDPESNASQLGEIRRIFHTLKGSGRLVGAEAIGEFGWQLENMCNRLLDSGIQYSTNFRTVLADGVEMAAGLFAALQNQSVVPSGYDLLLRNAENVANGDDLEEKVEVAAVEDDVVSNDQSQVVSPDLEFSEESIQSDSNDQDVELESALLNEGDDESEDLEDELEALEDMEDLELELEFDSSLEEDEDEDDDDDDDEEDEDEDDDEDDEDEDDDEDDDDEDDDEDDDDEDDDEDEDEDDDEDDDEDEDEDDEDEDEDDLFEFESIEIPETADLEEELASETLSLEDEMDLEKELSLLELDDDEDEIAELGTDDEGVDFTELSGDLSDELEELTDNEATEDELDIDLEDEVEFLTDEADMVSDEIDLKASDDDTSVLDEVDDVSLDSDSDDESLSVVTEQSKEPESERSVEDDLEIDPVFIEILQKEVGGHLHEMNKFVSDCMEQDNPKVNDDFVRVVHTLNGAASMASVDGITKMTTPLEKFSILMVNKNESLSDEDVEHIEQVVHHAKSQLNLLGTGTVPVDESIGNYFKLRLEQLQSQVKVDSKTVDEVVEPDANKTETDATVSDTVEHLEIQPEATDNADKTSANEASQQSYNPFQEESEDADETAASAYDESELDDELLEIFSEEASEIFDRADHMLAELEEKPSDLAIIQALQRDLHTLKGGARMAGLNQIGDLAHQLESLFESIAEKNIEVNSDQHELMSQVMHKLHGMVNSDDYGQLSSIEEETAQLEQILSTEGAEIKEKSKLDEEFFDPLAQREETSPDSQDDVETIVHKRKANVLSGGQIKVNSELLDKLVNFAGEVSIYRSRMEQQAAELRLNIDELENTVERVRRQLRELEHETEAQIISNYQIEGDELEEDFDPLELDQFSTIQQLSRSLSESVSDLTNIQTYLQESARSSETLLIQQSRVNTELQEGLMETRLVTFNSLIPRLRRVLRTASQELNKKAKLIVNGAEGEMDKTVLEGIQAPLEHMIRNAVVHGLEADRDAVNKAEQGRIVIQLSREATEVVITVKDDGAGINTDVLRKKAIERGIIKKEDQLSEQEIAQLITHSGLSAANEVTKLAGRGVGMDVVNNEIKRLGGSIEIISKQGEGTTFVIRLPYTLALTQAIIVQVADHRYAIPASGVEGLIRMSIDEFRRRILENDLNYDYAGEAYQIQELNKLLNVDSEALVEGNQVPLVMIKSGDQGVALRVDQTYGGREIVVKSVGTQVASVPGIFGATILGDGAVVLILDIIPMHRAYVQRMARLMSEGIQVVQEVEEDRVTTIMVVDDSITMRRAGERMLTRNDFEVMTAKDGLDALNKLQEQIPDVMLLDIEMPRMDGFELATAMKQSDRLKDIPIIMITSRTGQKHKDRAKEIGVDRYLGKPYQELELLENINELLQLEDA